MSRRKPRPHTAPRDASRQAPLDAGGAGSASPGTGSAGTATATATAPPAAPTRTLYALFVLSGLIGLVYEATWTRYLQLFLGHAAYAQVLVMALFMGGMGAGALIASRLTARGRSPLRGYALAEALLGVAALAFHPLYVALTETAYAHWLPPGDAQAGATALQWALAALLLLPQSVLLGTTFPLMSAALVRAGPSGAGRGRVFSMLYFCNSAGAAAGVLLAGHVLFEHAGLPRTLVIAGSANLLVAAGAWWGSRTLPTRAAEVRPAGGEPLALGLLALAFLTAVASFFYEIAWLRMMALVQGASTHAFETTLSVFILGLALGGLWIRGRIDRIAEPLAWLGRIQVLMGVAAAATLPAYLGVFDAMAFIMGHLQRNDAGYAAYGIAGWLLSAVVMMPAAFLAGATLPLITAVLYARGRGESEIGAVYGWNTLGSIAGIGLGALVLMPLLGLKGLVLAGAALDVALGLVLLALRARRAPGSRRTDAAMGVIAVVVLTVVLGAIELDPARTASGVFRYGHAHLTHDAHVRFHADGRTATVNIIEFPDGRSAITTNGKSDAAISMTRARGDRSAAPSSDEYTMTLLGALPLAHLPQARHAAVIGHGSGLTTHVLLASPHLQRVDVIEIEPNMIEAARHFLPRVQRAYEDPRARFVVDDARAVFARSPAAYDLIVSEPSNPWVSGVASLFTPEFYRQTRRSLAPGGVFVQWLHLYEIDRPEVASIVAALAEVFPDYVIYAPNDNDLVVVASASAPVPAIDATLFDWPAMQEDLRHLGIASFDHLRLYRLASRRAVAPLLERKDPNSDFRPSLEFAAVRSRFMGRSDRRLIELASEPVPVLEWLSGWQAAPLPDDVPALLGGYRKRFNAVHRAALLARALKEGPGSPALAALSAQDQAAVSRVLEPQAHRSAFEWQLWEGAVSTLTQSLAPFGGFDALDRVLGSPSTIAAMKAAPEAVSERVAFLRAAGRRDAPRVVELASRLLQHKPDAASDTALAGYLLVTVATVCIADPAVRAHPVCAQSHEQLQRLPAGNPLVDLLQSHRQRGS